MVRKIMTVMVIALMLASTAFAGSLSKTMLSAVGATGASSDYYTGDCETKTIYIVATSVSSGATVAIQTSYDGTNYATISTQTIAASGVTEVAIVGLYHKFIRANVTVWTDGAYSVYLFGKQ